MQIQNAVRTVFKDMARGRTAFLEQDIQTATRLGLANPSVYRHIEAEECARVMCHPLEGMIGFIFNIGKFSKTNATIKKTEKSREMINQKFEQLYPKTKELREQIWERFSK
jgi:hypothetical protein